VHKRLERLSVPRALKLWSRGLMHVLGGERGQETDGRL
jgi:hypothetical protein